METKNLIRNFSTHYPDKGRITESEMMSSASEYRRGFQDAKQANRENIELLVKEIESLIEYAENDKLYYKELEHARQVIFNFKK
jgi:hypothetical protein